jgi:hypothetical protein
MIVVHRGDHNGGIEKQFPAQPLLDYREKLLDIRRRGHAISFDLGKPAYFPAASGNTRKVAERKRSLIVAASPDKKEGHALLRAGAMAGAAFKAVEVEICIRKPCVFPNVVFVAARADSHPLLRIQLLVRLDIMRVVALGAGQGPSLRVGGVNVSVARSLVASNTDGSINTLSRSLVEKMHIMTFLAANAFSFMHG